MPSFWKHVNQVIREADLIIEVLDARMIEETHNKEIENKIERSGKQILYVINKCDLVKKEDMEKIKKKLKPSVFISSTKKLGTTILLKKILELSKGEKVIVGILGYPNVGKSSLINALSGRAPTRVSSESGFTKGQQKVRISPKIILIDTPGVFPDKEKNEVKHGKTGAQSYEKIKDPELIALKLIAEKTELIKNHYQLSGENEDEILVNLAFKFNLLSKGKTANLEVAARKLLKDWQTGKIK